MCQPQHFAMKAHSTTSDLMKPPITTGWQHPGYVCVTSRSGLWSSARITDFELRGIKPRSIDPEKVL
jgi:hypothetical protein